jgi:hypothetical protein
MKVKLTSSILVPSPGIPSFCKDDTGIDLNEIMLAQYEQIRTAYIAARDNLIAAYKQGGGVY